MIPTEKSEAVAEGLREAFGVTELEDIRALTGGFTASLVFRIVVRGSAFLLKINTRRYSAETLTRQFACMRAAAEAGLAPQVRYTSVPDQMSITDFVEAVPLPVTDALVRMPTTLRALHALPRFGPVPDHLNTSCMFLLNKGPALDGFLGTFQAANLVPKGECDEVFARYAQLAAIHPRHDSEWVSSHNDLKPENILFDGRRVWLVDWEAAFVNDRYADLAVIANFVAGSDAEEGVYLRAYFGQAPDPYQQARFFLMQQVVHMFHGMAYLLAGSSGEPMNGSENTPGFREFQRRNWAGEIAVESKLMKTVKGRLHWEQLVQNIRPARFDEALRIVSAWNPV